ncbi:MAG: DUF4292 domain-containing protein [Runella slithyformis]|nr:MAG: DUF4292 domain-containing protein [Runella slithyformis]TAE97001.1 MAG: DUF4292 domain-containing protein [Runella slithyformis]TAF28758.1 MAG: DUF4292 domain-containing protein [Runella slithyformis]TAF47808.1 MAG: DUF4292 domain-containing protein [Runella slithyformis]TAF82751.1 MAG: DUF4292 domain-containing protein [Runella slithyformis]
MNSKIWWYGSVAAIMSLTACHKSRQRTIPAAFSDSVAVTQPAAAPTKPLSDSTAAATELDETKFNATDIEFKYLTAKSKISFKSKDQNIDDANVNMRIKKDSIIWLYISKLGFEAARAIVRQDSVFVMDKIHAEYYAYSYEQLSKKFNFGLSYNLIQSILIGNMPIPKQPNQRFKKEKDYFMLRQQEGKILIDNYIGEKSRRLKKLMATDQPTKTSLTLDYDDFTELSNFIFPYTSLLKLDYQSAQDQQFYQTVFKIKHQKIELTDQKLEFPFVIPTKYKRK